MKIGLINMPWYGEDRPGEWGVRAGSRWPHFQPVPPGAAHPRYVPFPFMMAIAASAVAGAGHEVLLLDAVAEGITVEAMIARLRDFGPELIFAETSTPSLAYDLRLLHRVRDAIPGARLICGGTHPVSLVPEMIRAGGVPDFWLGGEYDGSLPELVELLSGGESPMTVAGLVAAGSGVPAALAGVEDLDRLPQPLWEQLPMSVYSDPVCGLPSPSAQTWLSRGCPFGCTFCVWPQVVYGNRRYRTRSIDRALDEVQSMIDRYGCESFYFDDDTTNLGEERMEALARAIRERGLDRYPWAMMARADCMTPRMIDALAGAGMYSVKYGVESAVPQLCDACDKKTDWRRFNDAIARTQAAGVKVHLTFTLGIPGETEETIRQTLEFAMRIAPETAQFSICTPFPGTEFYETCRREGWLMTEDWSRFLGSGEAVIGTPWLSAEALVREHDVCVKRWRGFVAERLTRRRVALVARLREHAGRGGRWTLVGDRDFADFLFDPVSGVGGGYVGAPAGGEWIVIVSRQDEERIRRRMERGGAGSPGRVLGLYAMENPVPERR